MIRALTAVLAAILVAFVPDAAQAGTPSAGVAQEIRSGFFADVNLGGFFTATGLNSKGNKGVSNPQAYLQLGVGYDVAKFLAVGAHFGIGSSANSCFATRVGDKCLSGATVVSDSFTLTMLGAEGVFKVAVGERLFLRPRIDVGWTFLEPAPAVDKDGKEVGGGAYVGAGFGIEYATHMDHFSIGLDIGGKFIIGPNIPVFAFYPMIKYTF